MNVLNSRSSDREYVNTYTNTLDSLDLLQYIDDIVRALGVDDHGSLWGGGTLGVRSL